MGGQISLFGAAATPVPATPRRVARKYESIGRWQVSTEIPEPVRMLLRVQQHDLEAHRPLPWLPEERRPPVQRCMFEDLFYGDAALMVPDPFMAYTYYTNSCGKDRYSEAIAKLEQRLERLRKPYLSSDDAVLAHITPIEGSALVATLEPVVFASDAQSWVTGQYAVGLKIYWTTKDCYVLPSPMMRTFWGMNANS